jgi:hypothetical protein
MHLPKPRPFRFDPSRDWFRESIRIENPSAAEMLRSSSSASSKAAGWALGVGRWALGVSAFADFS